MMNQSTPNDELEARPHDIAHLQNDLAQAMYATNRAIAYIEEWVPAIFRNEAEQNDLNALIAGRDHIWAMRQRLDSTLKD